MMLATLGLGVAAAARGIEFAQVGDTESTVVVLPSGPSYVMNSTTFRSRAMPLMPGEVVFTEPAYLPMPFSLGGYAITGFKAEVVDRAGVSVPLSEVYNHHWLVFDKVQNGGLCSGPVSRRPDLGYIFGVGAECRNTPVVFPPGMGYYAAGMGLHEWTANIHLLRTVGLTATKSTPPTTSPLKACIECYYTPERASKTCRPDTSGTFSCCPNGSFCSAEKGAAKDYFLQYTVHWTAEHTKLRPLKVNVMDAEYNNRQCQIEYNIEANNAAPLHVLNTKWLVPAGYGSTDIHFAAGHVHNAGRGIVLIVNKNTICASNATYGKREGVAGDEAGYLVEMGTCSSDGTRPIASVRPGDTVEVESYYWVGDKMPDPTGSSLPGGFHGGVMSLFYIAGTGQRGTPAEQGITDGWIHLGTTARNTAA